MAENTRAARFRRWLAVWYAALMESSRLAGVDWTGWRVD
jgi:hypothetical protein